MGFLGGQPRGCQTLYFLLAPIYTGGLRYEKGSTPLLLVQAAKDFQTYIAREQWDRILEATGNVSPEKKCNSNLRSGNVLSSK